ncbi:hypothetical protein DNTS_023029 [Danionella cerebrum]|uniref:Uncharacterized protein n=1 Tax=Danionella cerebrum TaxID=2873325 RepID=A0A553QLZ5_9TELE|nr:hypothetical protein DNTS_023029 [Danionella translucida]
MKNLHVTICPAGRLLIQTQDNSTLTQRNCVRIPKHFLHQVTALELLPEDMSNEDTPVSGRTRSLAEDSTEAFGAVPALRVNLLKDSE